jgi:ATPase subunit of ABC transporter with duplicated ATPase domains
VKEIERLEDFVARNKARVATRGMANSRAKRLEKMERIELKAEKPKPEFNFMMGRTPSRVIVETENLVIGYDEAISAPMNLKLEKGMKIALTGANGLSLDGEMVNIDGNGNRVGAIIYGPKNVLVIAGMNKVMDTLEDAVTRARTVAAPINQQRFLKNTPCAVTGICAGCKSPECICNHIVITRNCRPAGRIKFIIVGEELGF